MFRISRKTDYAIRILFALARRRSDALVLTRTLRQEMLIPKSLAPQIVATLVNHGLLEAVPGRNGGVRLARPPESITLREVVEIFEKDLTLSECVVSPSICPLASACPVRRRWVRLQNLLMEELERTTMAELATEADAIVTSEGNKEVLV